MEENKSFAWSLAVPSAGYLGNGLDFDKGLPGQFGDLDTRTSGLVRKIPGIYIVEGGEITEIR